eukprot:scaffold19.g1781.t1
MAGPSAVYTQLHPPSGATHCVAAFLTHPAAPGSGGWAGGGGAPSAAAPLPNLVLARATCLEVYALRRVPAAQPGAGSGGGSEDAPPQQARAAGGKEETRLEVLASLPLWGVVESLAVLPSRQGEQQRDAVLLTFRDAKLVVLQWDPQRWGLVASGLHYFEGDASLKAGRTVFPNPPLAVADPLGRCAAVVMLRHQLVVLPAVASEAAALGIASPRSPGAAGLLGPELLEGELAPGSATLANSYVDNLAQSGIKEIRDATFLHGYAEPKDTMSLTALSLNLSRKSRPRIWGAAHLPADAARLAAAPCGGALVLCLNCVLYYSQTNQTGVVLNSAALPMPAPPTPLVFDPRAKGGPGAVAAAYARHHPTDVHPEVAAAALQHCDASHASLNVTCDGAGVAWLGPETALLALRSGQLLLLVLCAEPGGRRALAVARAGAAPPPSCACALAPGLLFLGSAVGDSLLVRAAPAPGPTAPGAKRGAEAVAAGDGKRLRLVSAEEGREQAQHLQHAAEAAAAAAAAGAPPGDMAAAAAAATAMKEEDEEDEEALLYGGALAAAPGVSAPGAPGAYSMHYYLSVLDALAGTAPLHDVAVGPPPPDPATGSAAGGAPYLVACSGGAGRGGALVVMRQRLVPDVITEVPLPGLLGAWALLHVPDAPQADAAGPSRWERHHAYLLLSFQGSTKVLLTGEELREVSDEVEFALDAPTLAAGSICGRRRMVQVFPQGLRVMAGAEMQQDVWAKDLAPPDATIVAADICDPYVLVLLSSGGAALLVADAAAGSLGPPPDPAHATAAAAVLGRGAASQPAITAACLHFDSCNWLRRNVGSDGGSAGAGHYCLVAMQGGGCELYELPTWRSVFACGSLLEAPPLLLDRSSSDGTGQPLQEQQQQQQQAAGAAGSIVEVRLESFGPAGEGRGDPGAARSSRAPACEAPVLVTLASDHTLLAYQAFASSGDEDGDDGGLRLRRLPLGLPPLLPPPPPPPAAAPQPPQLLRRQRLVRFDALGEDSPHAGIFLAGAHPAWLLATRGSLLAHPHLLPPGAAAGSFTPFHNVNCPHGFIAVCSGSRECIQICQLPPRTRLDCAWPRQKVTLKATPLRIAHYPEANLFAVLASRPVPFKPWLPEEEGGEPQASYAYALAEAAAKARGSMDGHEVRLVRPGAWATLWRHALLPGEHALSVAAVHLKDHTTGNTVPLIAVGAGLPVGEDYPCGGRLLLFEVTRAGAGSAGKGSGLKVDLIYSREFRGPVTAVSTVEGYLLVATGNRIETCTLTSATRAAGGPDDDVNATVTTWRLIRSAFFDGPMLLASVNVVKNFVLLGDIHASVQFVRYTDEGRQLRLLSKDFNRCDVAASEFLISGPSLQLVVGDAGGTLRGYSYAPNNPESWKGQRLVAWGAFHTGQRVAAMRRLRLHPPDPADRAARQGVLCAGCSGELALLAPLLLPPAGGGAAQDASAVAAALKALQKDLALLVPAAAGLNPATFRRRYARLPRGMQGGQAFSKPLTSEQASGSGILDGDLLLLFAQLPRSVQEAAAARVGLGRERVLQLLAAIARTAVVL